MAHARAAHRAAEARWSSMGEEAVEFLNALGFPLADPLEPEPASGLQRFTATIEALVVPDIDAALDEAAGEDGVLERLQGARPLVGGAAALLAAGRAGRVRGLLRSALARLRRLRRHLGDARGSGRDVALPRRRRSSRRCSRVVWLALPLARRARAAAGRCSRSPCSPSLLRVAELDVALQPREALRARPRSASGSSSSSRRSRGWCSSPR